MALPDLNRREFLKGCCASAALGAGAPALLFSPEAVAANPYDTLVHVFLRGGIDGLNLVVPVSGNDRVFYEQARPSLNIAATGTYGALPLTLANGSATGFGLHPSATGLRDLWNASRMAIVHGCGLLTTVTRSHFDAQLYLDLGTPGQQGGGTGWMTRAWATQPGTSGGETMPMLAVNSRQPASLIGATQALSMASPSDFQLNRGAWQWQTFRSGMPAGTKGVNEIMDTFWNGRSGVETDGQRASRALRTVASQAYAARPTGWPTGTFADQLWTVAQSIRFNMGLRYAAVDLGGWDTHDGQGTAGSGYNYYQNKIAELSAGLSALFDNLQAGGELSRVTVIVQSEFGRRVRQNGNGGTDHGYGNPLLVIGGPVNGRRFYGQWLGLDPEILSPYFGDVPVTTDYRRVFSEFMIRRMANNKVSTVFPGYAGYAPFGMFQGTDLTPQIVQGDMAQAMAKPSTVQAEATAEHGVSHGPVDRMLVRRGL